MNIIGIKTIFLKEIGRSKDVAIQAFLSPIISTVLYFLVFGSAIGSRMESHNGIHYAAFIVPGLILMALTMNSLMASSSGIYFPRFIGTIDSILSAPLSSFEIIVGFALAAIVRALGIGAVIYLVSALLTPVPVAHPIIAIAFSFLVSSAFAILGIIIGMWAKDFEQLSIIPTLILTPLSFLGGIFYSIELLPPVWKAVTLANPIFYMIDGLRWSFFDVSDGNPLLSAFFIVAFLLLECLILFRFFTSGRGLKN